MQNPVPHKTWNPSVAEIGDRKVTRIQERRADSSGIGDRKMTSIQERRANTSGLAFNSPLADHPTSLTHTPSTSGLAFHSPVLILCTLQVVRSERMVGTPHTHNKT